MATPGNGCIHGYAVVEMRPIRNESRWEGTRRDQPVPRVHVLLRPEVNCYPN